MAAGIGNQQKDEAEKKKSLAEVDIRPAETKDAEAICELFGKIFQDHMTLEHWRWKYERSMSRAIVVYRNGKLMAHYGGVGTDMLLEGKESTAVQITDLMVDPDARHGVRSHSPFFQASKMFLERYAGFENLFYLVFGFPSERATVLSEKLGILARVGKMHEITWKADASITGSDKQLVELNKQNFPYYAKKIDRLWQVFSKEFHDHFICLKNAEYFRWRYLDHPSKDYTVYLNLSRWRKTPKYLLVIRHQNNQSMLMDLLCTSLEITPLIAQARKIAGKAGKATLVTWCSDVFRELFTADAESEKSLQTAIPANTWSDGLSAEKQMNKWWFMPGDTDYL